MRERRRRRYRLLQFIEVVALFLEAGYDLAYGWPEAARSLAAPAPTGGSPKETQGASLAERLDALAERYEDPSHRIWFAMLAELYRSGAGLRDAVAAMAAALRSEHERDLEAHCRELPTKLNVGLVLFYLPATLLLLFAPLVAELTGSAPAVYGARRENADGMAPRRHFSGKRVRVSCGNGDRVAGTPLAKVVRAGSGLRGGSS